MLTLKWDKNGNYFSVSGLISYNLAEIAECMTVYTQQQNIIGLTVVTGRETVREMAMFDVPLYEPS